MSTVVARASNAGDQLVYTWPYPIGGDCEIVCDADDTVIVCPAWTLGERFGVGRHRWRAQDPTKPTAAYFVTSAPVAIGFDFQTSLRIPLTQQPVRIRAHGAVSVRCVDPSLLVAQFVGLPFWDVDRGIKQSVARSVERILARVLVRRCVSSSSTLPLIDPAVRSSIIEELSANHPTGGAAFGIEYRRLLSLEVSVDDGTAPLASVASGRPPQARPSVTSRDPDMQAEIARSKTPPAGIPTPLMMPAVAPPVMAPDFDRTPAAGVPAAPPRAASAGPTPVDGRTVRGHSPLGESVDEILARAKQQRANSQAGLSNPAAIVDTEPTSAVSSPGMRALSSPGESRERASTAGEISTNVREPVRQSSSSEDVTPRPAKASSSSVASGEISGERGGAAASVAAASSSPGIAISQAPTIRHAPLGGPAAPAKQPDVLQEDLDDEPDAPPTIRDTRTPTERDESRGAILAIGGGGIGVGNSLAGEVSTKVAAGGRVLIPGKNGLMQSATVKQLLAGYYEVEVGATGEVVWVPAANVVPA